MKRILVLLLAVVSLLLSACTPQSESQIQQASQPQVESTLAPAEISENPAVSEDNAPFLAVSVPMTTDYFYADDSTELFSHSYQYMKLSFPDEEVIRKVTIEFLNRVDAGQIYAKSILEMAEESYEQANNWMPFFYRVVYNPVRIDYSVLSLFGMQNSYSGGMHGDVSGLAVNYDMATGDVLTFGSIMHADADKEDFIQIILKKLSENADSLYLYDDYEIAVRQRLSGDENLYEDFYFTTTGLNFFFSPYEIAPYSSGIITVEIPYNELNGLLYEDYFPTVHNSADGNMELDVYADIPIDQFNSMLEINLEGNEELYILHSKGVVEGVQISVTGNRATVPDYTAFLAYALTDYDAVVLQIAENGTEHLHISYQSNNECHSVVLP